MVSSSLSSYSSSELGQDIRNLISERREAENLYSEATLVGRLEQCLNAVKTTLSTSKEETNVAQMRADEDHARTAGKISLKSLCFYIHNFIR
jgi:RNA recognition motif-containing protein